MKMVVLDARGLIGEKVVTAIRGRRHEVFAASPEVGVNVATGEGLTQSLAGAQVLIDVAGPVSCQDRAALELVEKCCLNVISAASAAHVKHHVALSEVGAGLLDSAYFRAQAARESLIEASPVPHTILRSTQFFESMERIDRFCVEGRNIRVAPACVQPVLSDEVAAALADLAVSFPRNSTLEMAGPERLRLDEVVRRLFSATRNVREVITDPRAGYFGAQVSDGALIPDDDAIIGVTRFEEWLNRLAVPEGLVPAAVTLRGESLDDAATSTAATALAEWYASHSVVRRLWAIKAVDAIRIVVTLEPTVDGDDTQPTWLAHSWSWAQELGLCMRRKVSLEMTNEPWRFESTFDRDIALIAELSWRDPTAATG